ncbi:hypothetical protein DPMN_072859 [Dreissena polymorpha]|uniref:Uncharacterized protein n=1 Tax=Dreissena polymorpha TaxID=45954 RepID=A0A9D4BY43_DREPO|nr:hypothetical protein DPMN_072859 [Dreissena polymorpha]
MAGKAVQKALWGHFCVDNCLHSKLISGRSEILLLLVQAEELYFSILMGKATQMLHVLTFRSNSRRLQRRRNMNLPKPQRQAKYCWLLDDAFSGSIQ